MPKQPLHKIFSTLPIKNDALTMDEEGNVENADVWEFYLIMRLFK